MRFAPGRLNFEFKSRLSTFSRNILHYAATSWDTRDGSFLHAALQSLPPPPWRSSGRAPCPPPGPCKAPLLVAGLLKRRSPAVGGSACDSRSRGVGALRNDDRLREVPDVEWALLFAVAFQNVDLFALLSCLVDSK